MMDGVIRHPRTWIISGVTFWLLIKNATAGFCASHYCLGTYQRRMRTVLGSRSDFTLPMFDPLQSIIKQTRNVVDARNKINAACVAMIRLRNCLNNCSGSLHKQVALAGMPPWNVLCAALDNPYSGVDDFLYCYKVHYADIESICRPYEVALRETLNNATAKLATHFYTDFGHICRAMRSYEFCVRSASEPCSTEARRLWEQIRTATQLALRSIASIEFVSSRLPIDCRPEYLYGQEEPIGYSVYRHTPNGPKDFRGSASAQATLVKSFAHQDYNNAWSHFTQGRGTTAAVGVRFQLPPSDDEFNHNEVPKETKSVGAKQPTALNVIFLFFSIACYHFTNKHQNM